ncbi:MAG: GNAT family N-acetyltransferase [Christensenellales bacterium]|jgi:hypothetical protein
MEPIVYRDVHAFAQEVMPLLTAREAEHNLPIGILDRGLGDPATCADWYMARLPWGEDSLIALCTPPHNLILASPRVGLPEGALDALIDQLARRNMAVPGVIGEKPLAHAFARRYAARRGLSYAVRTEERVYRLTELADVPRVGALRKAARKDLPFLPYWMKDFAEFCFGQPAELDPEGPARQVAQGLYYLLEVDGLPVSLAGSPRQTPHGRSVGPVYTPPYLRGRGYATACVAMLSERILSWGNDFCVLFADLANPVSNSVYQKIGYRPVCDVSDLSFTQG